MARKSHPYDEAADREIANFPGARVVSRETGTKQRRLVLEYRGQQRTVFYPKTPSDHRGPMRHACDVRKILRNMGGG